MLASGLNITIDEYYKLVKKARKWKPKDYPKTCPKCGARTKTSHFDNGWEIYCAKNDWSLSNYTRPPSCDWEIWIPNPLHPNNIEKYIRKEERQEDVRA